MSTPLINLNGQFGYHRIENERVKLINSYVHYQKRISIDLRENLRRRRVLFVHEYCFTMEATLIIVAG